MQILKQNKNNSKTNFNHLINYAKCYYPINYVNGYVDALFAHNIISSEQHIKLENIIKKRR